MSIVSASNAAIFGRPNNMRLLQKLLPDESFIIDKVTQIKGPQKVRVHLRVPNGTVYDPVTDTEVPTYIKHSVQINRVDIRDVIVNRLPSNVTGQPCVSFTGGMAGLNTALAAHGIFLEPNEFTLTLQAGTTHVLTAKENCVRFYGQVAFVNAEGTIPASEQSVPGTPPPVTPPQDLSYIVTNPNEEPMLDPNYTGTEWEPAAFKSLYTSRLAPALGMSQATVNLKPINWEFANFYSDYLVSQSDEPLDTAACNTFFYFNVTQSLTNNSLFTISGEPYNDLYVMKHNFLDIGDASAYTYWSNYNGPDLDSRYVMAIRYNPSMSGGEVFTIRDIQNRITVVDGRTYVAVSIPTPYTPDHTTAWYMFCADGITGLGAPLSDGFIHARLDSELHYVSVDNEGNLQRLLPPGVTYVINGNFDVISHKLRTALTYENKVINEDTMQEVDGYTMGIDIMVNEEGLDRWFSLDLTKQRQVKIALNAGGGENDNNLGSALLALVMNYDSVTGTVSIDVVQDGVAIDPVVECTYFGVNGSPLSTFDYTSLGDVVDIRIRGYLDSDTLNVTFTDSLNQTMSIAVQYAAPVDNINRLWVFGETDSHVSDSYVTITI